MKEKERKQEYQEYIEKMCKEIRTCGDIILNEKIDTPGVNTNVLTVMYNGKYFRLVQINGCFVQGEEVRGVFDVFNHRLV